MNSCELCKTPATIYCESDQASLCWDCDAKVHGANFLVARHLRALLCHACQSQTQWKASGARLGNTVSACERCVNGTNEGDEESEAGNDDDFDTEDGDLDLDGANDDYDVEEEDCDNQVVPWTCLTTPPPSTSSSSSEDSGTRISGAVTEPFGSINGLSLKRVRENDLNLRFEAHQSTNYGEAISDGSTRHYCRNRGVDQDTPSEDRVRIGSGRDLKLKNDS